MSAPRWKLDSALAGTSQQSFRQSQRLNKAAFVPTAKNKRNGMPSQSRNESVSCEIGWRIRGD